MLNFPRQGSTTALVQLTPVTQDWLYSNGIKWLKTYLAQNRADITLVNDNIQKMMKQAQQLQSKMQKDDATYILIGKDGILEGIVSMSDVRDAISPYLKSTFSKWRRPLDDATLQIRSKWS